MHCSPVILLVIVTGLLLGASLALRQELRHNDFRNSRVFHTPKSVYAGIEGTPDMHREAYYRNIESARGFSSTGTRNDAYFGDASTTDFDVGLSTYVSIQQSGFHHYCSLRCVDHHKSSYVTELVVVGRRGVEEKTQDLKCLV